MAIIDKIQLSGTVYTIGNETTTAVTSASTDNEIPTAKAVYDAIPQGGGGKAISAGTNISITTGETADTVSCTLPITSNGNGTALSFFSNSNVIQSSQSVNFGYSNSFGTNPTRIFNFGDDNSTPMYGNYYYVNFGDHNSLEGYGWDYTFGRYLKVTNQNETAFGKYNKSNTNTLFSIGNGTGSTTSARHNAFEIRQNGDIYLTKDGQDVKLQDQLGGGGGGITSGEVQTMIDESVSGKANSSDSTYSVNANIQNDGIYFTTLNKDGNQIDYSFEPQIRFQAPLYSDYNDGKVKISGVTAVTSASTDSEIPTAKAVNDKLGGLSLVKLTQAQYDALATKDSNVLYVIVG